VFTEFIFQFKNKITVKDESKRGFDRDLLCDSSYCRIKRRQFILEITDDRGRTENISFELFQDHSKLVDSFKTGSKVVVDFNLKGRKWANPEGIEKYYNTLQAWKIVNDTEKENI